MDRIRSSAEGQAVLAGSLVAFPLLDVLSLLEKTRHVGELKIVCEGSDDHFFVDGGDLIDPSGGATGRLFELACSGDAWFTVTAGTGPQAAGSRVALQTVIDHLTPRLSEWDDLRRTVPLDATAKMAPSTALPEVHVRADQWQVLSRLGSGRRVGDVVDETVGSPVETLRVLRELADAGLVALVGPGAAALPPPRRTPTPPLGTGGSHPDGATDHAGEGDGARARDGRARRGARGAEHPAPTGSGDDPTVEGRPGRQDRAGPSQTGPTVVDPRAPASLMPPPVATQRRASAGAGRSG